MVLTPRALLAGASVIAAAFLALLGVAYGSPGARWLDASAFQGFLGLQGTTLTPLAERVVALGNPTEVGLIGSALALVALARGRPRVAAFVLALLMLTSVSSQALKALLAYPRHEGLIAGSHIDPAAFPSGHATAAMAMAIALVVVMPSRLRPLAALSGAGLALGVSFSIVSLGWHLPSDVAGGYLLATGWALVLLAALRMADGLFPERSGRSRVAAVSRSVVERLAAIGLTAVVVAGAVAATGAAALGVVFRLPDLVGYAQDHTAFVVVAAWLALSAAALLAGVASALARRV
ncbi:MAG: phosphatase PAP2 family protein [Thermoleophilaceae bacterium]|nr:phosphatase PAP2 family protein [Thermoleophilaceae bacterium]